MKNRHTPGPWSCEPTGDQKRYIIGEGQSSYGTDVAEVYSDDIDPKEAKANARLIVAAPDLLEALIHTHIALREAMDRLESARMGRDVLPFTGPLEQGRAAIAKATGGAS